MAQKYPKPPIVEAVLHVRYGSPFSDGDLKRIPRLLKPTYPKSKEESDFQLELELKPGAGTTAAQPTPTIVDKGARLLSSNDDRVVVARSASIVFSQHAPYPGWDQFVSSAKDVFDTLRDKLGFRQVSSIGLRYINRLDIPLDETSTLFQPSEYLLVGVGLPANGITNDMQAFQAITDITINHDKLVARVQAATAVSALINHASLLFDIDIIAQFDIPQKADEFWSLVGRMRNDKNAIFESCVTDKARLLFGWKP